MLFHDVDRAKFYKTRLSDSKFYFIPISNISAHHIYSGGWNSKVWFKKLHWKCRLQDTNFMPLCLKNDIGIGNIFKSGE